MIKVLFICLGNICRSPMAEFVFKDMINKKGLQDKFYIDSAATSRYNEMAHEGMYGETKDILREMNIPFTEHFPRQIRKEDYEKFDYILAMEQKNRKQLQDENIIITKKNSRILTILEVVGKILKVIFYIVICILLTVGTTVLANSELRNQLINIINTNI